MNATITADRGTADKAPGADADSAATLNDAYRYMLALMTVNPSEAVRIQNQYGDDKLRDLFGTVSGVCLGIFGQMDADIRKQVEAPVRYALTGDKDALLESVKGIEDIEPEPVPGQYL